jgi:hypothetical protein
MTAQSGKPEFVVKPPKVTGMFFAVAAFSLGSIMALMGAIIALTALRADVDTIIPTAIFGSAAIITIAALLIRQLSRYMTMYREAVESPQPKAINAPPQFPQLDAPPRPVSSVTENTTRNFAPAPIDDWNARER